MLKISSNRISAGMILGRPIINAQQRFLLTAGQVLTERYIKRIKELQIPYVYIDERLGVEDPVPLINPATFAMAIDSLRQCYEQYSKTMRIDIRNVQTQVGNIIDDLVNNSYLMIGMSELKNYDDYTYQHSVNVCALSIILGISNGYDRLQLQNLGVGAILHDIGKIKIPLEIINKPTALTYDELVEVKKHPWEGFMMVNSAINLPKSSVYGILQHHERIDGRGYPRGLSEDNIHQYGLIIAVADVFDSLVSDRPYRPGFSNQEAMAIIEREKGTKLSPRFVDALFSHLNIYPPGTVVSLSNGDLAVVTQENLQDMKRPRLKLLFDVYKKIYAKDRSLNLADHKDIFITKTFSYSETENIMLQFLKLHKSN
ncbi:MAG: HD-GYP domain-containing protein [Syntrophomonadaceae bacterium]|nr:HD-GYP domain-containing protein [Syntrophomonadaceae bacterium]